MSVADLLVPNPYPLNVGAITTPNLTVTNDVSIGHNLTVGNTITSAGAAFLNGGLVVTTGTTTLTQPAALVYPLLINSAVASSALNGVHVIDGSSHGAEFGVNTTDASAYAFGDTGTDLKLGSNSTERARFLSSGIAVDPLATTALAQHGSTTIVSLPVAALPYSPVFTGTLGFTGGPSFSAGNYIRIGNMVMVTASFQNLVTTAGTTSTGTLTLPIATVTPLTASALMGTSTWDGPGNVCEIRPTLGSNTTATIAIAKSAAVQTSDVDVSFMYSVA